jgi:hypothetical protein
MAIRHAEQRQIKTGESYGIRKEEDVVVEQQAELADRKKMCYSKAVALFRAKFLYC